MWKTHSISSLSQNIFLSLLFVITNKANRLAWAQRQAKANAFVTVLYYEIDMSEVTPIKLGPNLQPEKCCYLSACQHHALCLLASSLPALLLTKSERPVNKQGRAPAPGCRSTNSGFVQVAGAQSSRDYRDEWTTRELWAKLRKLRVLCSWFMMDQIQHKEKQTQKKLWRSCLHFVFHLNVAIKPWRYHWWYFMVCKDNLRPHLHYNHSLKKPFTPYLINKKGSWRWSPDADVKITVLSANAR